MQKFWLVFKDGYKTHIYESGFSRAIARAAYNRLLTGADTHKQLTIDVPASNAYGRKMRSRKETIKAMY